MHRKLQLHVLYALLLTMTLTIAGCGRYAATDGSDDVDSAAAETASDESRDPSENAESNGELIPFAESQGFELTYGYMDQAGNVVIQPQFSSAEPFYACGLAIVSDSEGKMGLIDKTGKYVVGPEADNITYSDGVFIAQNFNANSRAYDETGALLFEQSDYIFSFSDGLSIRYGDASNGYIDKSGNMVLELPYKDLDVFCDGMAEVSMEYGGPSLLIDKQGNDLTDKISSGLRVIQDEQTRLLGYEDKNGNRIIEAQFLSATPFRDGLAIVGIDGGDRVTYGIIDTQGNYALEPEYCFIRRMRNGSFAVGENLEEGFPVPSMYADYSKRALFSKDLKKHTDWIFLEMDGYDENYTCVNDGKRIYYLDADLNQASDLPEFSGRGLMLADGQFLRGTINGHLTVADRKGNILVKDEKLTLLENGLRTRTVTRYPHDYTTITYPVLEGLTDTALQDELNKVIAEEAEGYGDSYEEDDQDLYFFPVIDANCSAVIVKDLLHIELGVEEYWIGAAHPGYYWNNVYVNIRDGKRYTIDDLFKSPEEGRKRLSQKVTEAMKEDPYMYFDDSVQPDQIQCFHLERDGLTVYFGEYEIAAYAAGIPQFYIPFSEIMDLINTEGDFWQSFN